MSDNKEEELESGKLLVAEPFLMDPNFKRGVILLCDHQEEGSFGFILNKPIEMNISDLISSFPEFKSEVYYGGPLQTDTIYYLHTKVNLFPNSVKVFAGVYGGGDFDQLKSFIKLGKIQPEDIRFFVGYAGWSPGQLHEERKLLSWMTADGHFDYIFGDNKELWKNVLEEQGGTYSVIAQIPTPILN